MRSTTLPGPEVRPVTDVDTTAVDVVIPVFNEEAALAASVNKLCDYLTAHCPYPWVVTITDNASTDRTLEVAERLAAERPGVRVRHLEEKGRGRALRAAWSASASDVVAYMDVDLSTDLDAFLPLVVPLLSGHSDVAIGSRLAPGATVARGPKREFISRSYNALLRALFATQVKDMQCGFKAVRRDVALALLPAIEDEGWFFDTELLLLAERNGLRIHQVPVDWTDDPDSRVDVTRTALDDLRGALRVANTFVRGGGLVEVPRRPPMDDDFGRHFVSFGLIGVLSTIATLAVFLLLRGPLGPVAANLVALTAAFVGNTWLNTRYSYRSRKPQWGAVAAVYGLTAVASTLALLGLDAIGAGVVAEVVALVVIWAAAGLGRLALLQRAVRRGESA
jgi:glycosyltransferase involved in cell wall biosynthesis